MVRSAEVEISIRKLWPSSGTKMLRFWRFAWRRTLPVGLNWVARVRLEYRPPTCVVFPVIAQLRAIVSAWYHTILPMQPDAALPIFTIAVLIFSIIIHEVAHGYAAYALGDPTAKLAKRLTLNPLRHLDPIGSVLLPAILVLSHSGFLFGWAKPVPYNPYNLKNQRWGEAIVAVAGVGTNLLLAVLFAFIARFAFASGMDTFGTLAASVTLVNLYLGIFNLLPIPPLDGYTFIRGLLPPAKAMAFREFEDRLRQGGFITLIVVLFVFSYFLSAPFSLFVSWLFALLIGG